MAEAFLKDDAEREKLRQAQEQFRYQLALYTTRFLSGSIDLQEWRVLFELELRYLYAIAGLLAVGDGRLTPLVARWVQQETEAQTQYLRRWAMSLALPTLRPSDALIQARAALYAGGADHAYSRIRAQALGVPDLPFYPGERSACMVNCKCYWRFVRLDGEGNWDCTWVRTAEESCPQCLRREEACAPLRIRNGLILPFASAGTVL